MRFLTSVALAIFLLVPSLGFSQVQLHHNILATIEPDKSQIKVVDVIELNQLSGMQELVFVLHDGDVPTAGGKGVTIKRLGKDVVKSRFPYLSNGQNAAGVPVAVYQLNRKESEGKITLQYSLNIKHMEGSVENGIRHSSGLIIPEGVYLDGGSLWLPRFGEELVSFRLSVQLPAGWRSVSQGGRIYTEDESTYHIDTWQEMNPQDNIFLVAAKFTEYSDNASGIAKMIFLRSPDENLAKQYLDATEGFIKMYESFLGVYPYPKFALVENFWQTGFGMPSFTLIGSRIIRFPFILRSSYPHELLHNWWGNGVFVDYSRGNWSEGLTAYLADHLMKEQSGKGVDYRRTALQDYTNFSNNDQEIAIRDFISSDGKVDGTIGYGKTALFFHMLRNKVGDDFFKQSLAAFYQKHQFQRASFQDLERAFSTVTGKPLIEFFKQWVERVGAPEIVLKNASVQNNGEFYEVSGVIEQIQNESYFPMRVPVYVALKDQETASRHTISLEGKETRFTIKLQQAPDFISLDSEFDVIRKLDGSETPPALSQLFSANKTVIIISSKEAEKLKQGYQELAKRWRRFGFSVAFDDRISELPSDVPVWLFGKNNRFLNEFIESVSLYPVTRSESGLLIGNEKFHYGMSSIVVVGDQGGRPLAFLSADSDGAVNGLSRKLSHYGKYSYLRFEGDEPTNSVKGQWPVVGSPLVHRWTDRPLDSVKYPKRNALVNH